MSKLVQIVSCCSLGFVFALMDTISYGKALIPNHEHLSMFIFLTSTIAAQIFYNLFTSIPSGIMASSIVENIKFFKMIHDKTQDTTNTLTCIFIATILVGVMSIILSKYSSFLKLTPKSAITGCLGAIGIAQFEVGLDEVQGKLLVYMLSLSLAIAFIGFLLQEKFPSVMYIVPLYTAIVVVLFYLYAYNNIKIMREDGVLSELQETVLGINLFTENFVFSKIRLQTVIDNIGNIFTVVVLSMIHLPINLPAYCLETGLSADFQREMKVQGVGNLISAFCFSPVYFVCSNSIFFRRSGGHKKILGVILAATLAIIFVYGTVIRSYIPVFILGMFPFLIGFSILYSTYIEVTKSTMFDCLVVISTLLIGAFYNMLGGMGYGIILNIVWFIKTYIQSIRIKSLPREEIIEAVSKAKGSHTISEKGVSTKENSFEIVIIDYILFFCTIPYFENSVKHIKKDATFVVTYDVDWLGRDCLYETLNRLAEGGTITLIGRFPSFDVKNLNEKVIYYESLEDYASGVQHKEKIKVGS